MSFLSGLHFSFTNWHRKLCSNTEGTSGELTGSNVPCTKPPIPPSPPNAKNVLFIAVDDLRPELGPYDYKNAPATPSLDKFAKTALTFKNAYIQYSFCCPSRNSFMSGRRPSKTKVWNFIDHFREPQIGGGATPWVSLPGWFVQHGYYVHGMGKMYHPGNPPNNDGALSWTDPGRYSQGGETPDIPDGDFARQSTAAASAAAAAGPPLGEDWESIMHGEGGGGGGGGGGCITGEPGGSYCEIDGTSGPDDSLMNAAVASLPLLANYSKHTGRPFFMGCGFHKPHIPWTIPTRFFTKSINETDSPLHPQVPSLMPPIAWNEGLGHNALDSYKDVRCSFVQ
jgi:arylsulfatase A-like enzyme